MFKTETQDNENIGHWEGRAFGEYRALGTDGPVNLGTKIMEHENLEA